MKPAYPERPRHMDSKWKWEAADSKKEFRDRGGKCRGFGNKRFAV